MPEPTDRDRWNTRYRDNDGVGAPSAWLTSLAMIPTTGRALDVAGGSGRNALWLATRGLDVTLVDVADEALALARETASGSGTHLETAAIDLTHRELPVGPWDVVLCFHYLQRELFEQMARILAPGGLLVVALATVANLERHKRPALRYLLEEGELPGLVPTLEVILYEEGWLDEGRHEGRLVATPPPYASNGP